LAHCARVAAHTEANPAAHQNAQKPAARSNTVKLPVSRLDIADYLGLTIETVSRTLTFLEFAAAIEVPTLRRIVLSNRSALT
jgi:CRP/FNR family nitrogen fixation transcriptional regulator